jgi:hypothetical protein
VTNRLWDLVSVWVTPLAVALRLSAPPRTRFVPNGDPTVNVVSTVVVVLFAFTTILAEIPWDLTFSEDVEPHPDIRIVEQRARR